jgi:hypothetical protein
MLDDNPAGELARPGRAVHGAMKYLKRSARNALRTL